MGPTATRADLGGDASLIIVGSVSGPVISPMRWGGQGRGSAEIGAGDSRIAVRATPGGGGVAAFD